jgi:dissimilatory sulfite reductase (desulfoviridin) alpha/beta subunit
LPGKADREESSEESVGAKARVVAVECPFDCTWPASNDLTDCGTFEKQISELKV